MLHIPRAAAAPPPTAPPSTRVAQLRRYHGPRRHQPGAHLQHDADAVAAHVARPPNVWHLLLIRERRGRPARPGLGRARAD
eukprot:5454803-Prymnesium_polylepis.1